jgi:hypothetical protein
MEKEASKGRCRPPVIRDSGLGILILKNIRSGHRRAYNDIGGY